MLVSTLLLLMSAGAINTKWTGFTRLTRCSFDVSTPQSCQSCKSYLSLALSTDATDARCECAVRWPYPESPDETREKECRWRAGNRAAPVPPGRRDEATHPSRCDDRGASDRESSPGQRQRPATAS